MLDHKFVEWALSLPRRMKIADGAGKFILKRAFERLVPREILYRPKQGFSVPLADWFRGALGAAFHQDLAAREVLAESGFFNIALIDRMVNQHRSGFRDHSRFLWLLWNFHRFLVDVHAASPSDSVQIDHQPATT
jgi:asparagine synthase (glutamine-hydrolysing)